MAVTGISPAEVNQLHLTSDVDTSDWAQHHTLGPGAGQASPGNHIHDGRTSKKLSGGGPIGDTSPIAFRKFYIAAVGTFTTNTWGNIGGWAESVSEGHDPDALINFNGTIGRVTFNQDGLYTIQLDLTNTSPVSASGSRYCRFQRNDGYIETDIGPPVVVAAHGPRMQNVLTSWFKAGQTITLQFYQNSGADMSLPVNATGAPQHFLVTYYGNSAIKGDIGPAGPQGVQGPQGNTGAQGPQGIQGPIGSTGPKGDKGDTGPQGIQGPIGPTGNTGPQGPIGNTGPQGPAGADSTVPGPQGPPGNTGPQGDTGLAGSRWWYGTTNPAAGLGVLNDFYLNTTNGQTWSKLAGGWTFIDNLTGPQGPAGPSGASGITIKDEGSNMGAGITTLDFQGTGVVATPIGGGEVIVTVTSSANTPSDTTPASIQIVGAPGTSSQFSRGDHYHPGTVVSDSTPNPIATLGSAGSSASSSRSDHTHRGATPAISNPLDVSTSAAAIGSSTLFAREDHVHKIDSLIATILNPPRSHLYMTADANISANTWTLVGSGMAGKYSKGGIVLSNSRTTVPINGLYAIYAQAVYAVATVAPTMAGIMIRKNANGGSASGTVLCTLYNSQYQSGLRQFGANAYIEVELLANDYVEFFTYQAAASGTAPLDGTATADTTYLTARWVAPL